MLVIQVESRAGEPLASPLSARFGNEGGDIGRGADCTLVLPDPERSISRKHLRVARQGDLYLLRLISSNLLVELNGVPLAPGVEYPMASGAEIRVGPFVLRTREEPDAEPAWDDAGVDLLLPDRRRRPRIVNVFDHVLSGAEGPPAAQTSPAADDAVDDAADAQALLDALQAGLSLKPAAAHTPEQMRLVGAALRALVGGTLSLLDSRNLAKRALGAGQTMSLRRPNNPLKASRDVDAALARLLGGQQAEDAVGGRPLGLGLRGDLHRVVDERVTRVDLDQIMHQQHGHDPLEIGPRRGMLAEDHRQRAHVPGMLRGVLPPRAVDEMVAADDPLQLVDFDGEGDLGGQAVLFWRDSHARHPNVR